MPSPSPGKPRSNSVEGGSLNASWTTTVRFCCWLCLARLLRNLHAHTARAFAAVADTPPPLSSLPNQIAAVELQLGATAAKHVESEAIDDSSLPVATTTYGATGALCYCSSCHAGAQCAWHDACMVQCTVAGATLAGTAVGLFA
eukprot:213604-Chlamydomonas_euryale.AAC.20